MRSSTIDLDGPLHYVDFGGNGPTVVMVHGLGGSHLNWMAVGAKLAAHARVVAPDLAGFGRTPLAGRSASVEANMKLLVRFAERVAGAGGAGGGPVILIGNSMGGLISLMLAADHPEAVAGLVLVNPAIPAPSLLPKDALVFASFAAYVTPGLGPFLLEKRAKALGPERMAREMLKLVCADPTKIAAEVMDAHVALAKERAPMAWAHPAFLEAAKSVVSSILRSGLLPGIAQRIRAPTLLVHGDRDRLIPLDAARALHALRPDWPLEVFEGVGHVPMMESPDRFAEVVGRFVAGLNSRTA